MTEKKKNINLQHPLAPTIIKEFFKNKSSHTLSPLNNQKIN
jgi:hypothetical protein